MWFEEEKIIFDEERIARKEADQEGHMYRVKT